MVMTTFSASVSGTAAKAYFVVPFDPDEVWGPRPRHLLRGTINGCGFRGAVERVDGEWRCSLGPVWRRDNGVAVGSKLACSLDVEGPQRGDLAPDIVEALESSPAAAAFFDGLAQFYRKAYLTWINGTKTRPDERARRVAEMVSLLEEGRKTRT